MVRPTVNGVRLRLNARVPLDLYRRLSAVAVARHLPLNVVVCEALSEWVDVNAPLREDRPK